MHYKRVKTLVGDLNCELYSKELFLFFLVYCRVSLHLLVSTRVCIPVSRKFCILTFFFFKKNKTLSVNASKHQNLINLWLIRVRIIHWFESFNCN